MGGILASVESGDHEGLIIPNAVIHVMVSGILLGNAPRTSSGILYGLDSSSINISLCVLSFISCRRFLHGCVMFWAFGS